MADRYHEGNRQLQDRFDTRRLADRIEERIRRDRFDDDDRAFIEARDMFFLATADEHGQPQCSYKGGDPGFVRVVDEHTLAFPSYDGNGMYLSLGNVLRQPAGRAPVRRLREPEAAARQRHRLDRRGRPAARRRTPRRSSWCGCARRTCCRTAPATCTGWSSWSARASSRTRSARRRCPDWKRREWSHDVLPEGDPARAEGLLPGLIPLRRMRSPRPHLRAQLLEEEPAGEHERADGDERERPGGRAERAEVVEEDLREAEAEER